MGLLLIIIVNSCTRSKSNSKWVSLRVVYTNGDVDTINTCYYSYRSWSSDGLQTLTIDKDDCTCNTPHRISGIRYYNVLDKSDKCKEDEK